MDIHTIEALIKETTFEYTVRCCHNCATTIDDDHYMIKGNNILCSGCGEVLGVVPKELLEC